MSTLGQKPATQHVSTEKQTITGNGGTSYTLQQSVSQASDIEVFVNNTRQEPTVAYTANNTTLTMTGAVNSSDSFYVIFQGKAIQTAGLPVDAAITASTISASQTLAVTGNTTVGGTLGVTGNTTAGGTLGVTGNTTVGGTLGVTGTTTLSGAANITGLLASSVGQNFAPEFIGNLYLAGNTSDAAELTGCFTNTHQIYRLVGQVGASHAGESSTRFFFLSGTDTKLASGYFGRGLAYDDASTSSGTAQADGGYFKININQSSTGSSIVDMHFYRQQHAYQVLGMSGYHDQSSDRGFFHFGFKNNSALELTGFRLENDAGNNMSMINFSVYGYRLRQNSNSEMLGAYQ